MSKRWKLLGASLVVVLAIGGSIHLATQADAAGPNLLGTAGFESPVVASASARFELGNTIGLCKPGTPANVPQNGCWTVAWGNVDLWHGSTITPKGGTQYLELNGTQIGMVAQSVKVAANTRYELIYWSRSGSTGAMAVRASIYWYRSDGNIITSTPLVSQPVDATWRQYVITSQSPANAVLARIYLRSDTEIARGIGPLVDQVTFRTA